MHAWDVAHAGKLTTRQTKLKEDLLDQHGLLIRRYHGLPPFDENFDGEYQKFNRLILAANRAGLGHHPLVYSGMIGIRLQRHLDAWVRRAPWEKVPQVRQRIVEGLLHVEKGKVRLFDVYEGLQAWDIMRKVTWLAFRQACARNHFLGDAIARTGLLPTHILSYLLTSPHGFLDRTSLSSLLRRHVPSHRIDLALYALQKDDLIAIEEHKSPKGGRPQTVIRLAI
jgi:hypothetical protein